MLLEKHTLCGRCGSDTVQKYFRPKTDSKSLVLVTMCLDEHCNRAEGLLLSFDGDPKAYLNKPGDLVGTIFDIGKDKLALYTEDHDTEDHVRNFITK